MLTQSIEGTLKNAHRLLRDHRLRGSVPKRSPEPGVLPQNMLYSFRIGSDLKHCQVKVYLTSAHSVRGYSQALIPQKILYSVSVN